MQLLERTVTHGESNSLLVLGGRGHGKTAVCPGPAPSMGARVLGRASIRDSLPAMHPPPPRPSPLHGRAYTNCEPSLGPTPAQPSAWEGEHTRTASPASGPPRPRPSAWEGGVTAMQPTPPALFCTPLTRPVCDRDRGRW